jgi:hypothetical protein
MWSRGREEVAGVRVEDTSLHASEEVGVQLEEGFDGGGAEGTEDVDPSGRRHRTDGLFSSVRGGCSTKCTRPAKLLRRRSCRQTLS